MSHINPFHYNIIQNLPSEIMTNLLLSSQNAYPGANLQYNPYFFTNVNIPQIARNAQIKDYQSLILSQLALTYPGYFNPSMLLANQIIANAKNSSKSMNTISNSNPIVNQINNNSSFNLNFVNYLQNNNFLKYIYQYNQALNGNKSAKIDNEFSRITDQKIIKNNGIKNANVTKSENKKDEYVNLIKNPKNEVKNKIFLKHKTKRTNKKKKKLDSDDESEEDISSIYSSKNSEKNSTSSTETIHNHENKKLMRKFPKLDDKNLLLGNQEEYEKFFKNDKVSNDFTDFEKNLIEMIDNPRKKKKKSFDIDHENNSSDKFNELSEEIKAYLPFYEQEITELKNNKHHEFMMNNFPVHYQINNFYWNVKKRNERRSSDAFLRVEKSVVCPNPTSEGLNDFKCMWKPLNCETKEVEDYLFEVEKIWPNDEYKFSQEVSLKFLRSNNYNIESSLSMIRARDNTFIELIKQNLSKVQMNDVK